MKEIILFYTKISSFITLLACLDLFIYYIAPSLYNYLFLSMMVALRMFTDINAVILFIAGVYLLFKRATLKFGIISMVSVFAFFLLSTLVEFKLFSASSN